MPDKELVFEGEEMRLDNYLRRFYPNYSRELIKKIINSGLVSVNGKKPSPSVRLSSGDRVLVSSAKERISDISINIKEMIIYEDEFSLVINKPESLLVHPTDENWTRDREALSYGQSTLLSAIAKEYGKDFCAGDEKMGLVHRLDRETSGAMLVARRSDFAQAMRALFSSREVNKKYLGLVSGSLPEKKFSIDAPIGRACGDKRLGVYKYGREALTEIKTLKTGGGFSYLEISPRTGRTNQIRVHLSHIGTPIVGDYIYGGVLCERLMLHSLSLSFIHPFTGKKFSIEAKPSKEFMLIVKEKLGKK
ncbi:MAG: RluA family pseudouridine synthase [Elusimicrobiota bacterium]